jgi:hypothetical protein
MAQRESQLVAEGLAGPVPLVEDVPAPLLPAARLDVLSGYGARAADGRLNAECLDQGRPARQPCIRRHRLLLEGSGEIISDDLILGRHGRESFFSVENLFSHASRKQISGQSFSVHGASHCK